MLNRGLLAIALAFLLFAPFELRGQTPVEPIIRPATRELRQLLSRARKALDEQDYPAAVQALEELLTDPTLDDYFLAAPGQEESQVSVKTMGTQLLGTLPTAAKQLYETQVGHEARRRLNDALVARDVLALAEVARRYVHTKAGYEASFLLGRVELDQGRALAAALQLQPLCEQAGARDLLDPELSVLTATAWNHSRRPDKAVEVLVALKWRTPRVKVRLQDGEEPLFDREEDALKWLERIAGRGLAPAVAITNQWVMFRGDEARNAASAGGLPLVNAEWFNPVVIDPKLGERLTALARSLHDKGESAIPAIQPLAVTAKERSGKSGTKSVDYVLVRTPERTMAYSLRNGQVIWVYPPIDEPGNTAGKLTQGTQQAANVREATMRQRIWDDNLYNQLSSDGSQVYIVDDLEYMTATSSNQLRVVWNGMRQAVQNKSANKLTALNIHAQGKQVWTVGADSGWSDPNLAGAFFLGAPISVAEKLYAIAEFNGEIRLVCLAPETGALQWKQQLGSVSEENSTIRYDAVRRLAAASPSFANGLLICPTSAGALVAVDLGTRALKWNYVYERNDIPLTRTRGVITSSTTQVPVTGRWLDSTAVIAEGAVVITPVESGYLHCLDLITGQRKWDPIKREDYLFVGCIHRGKIILVGKKTVKAINLSDGQEAWKSPIDFGSEIVSGRGFYDGAHYFLPTTGRQLLQLDLETGKISEKSRTELNLGNLVSFAGEIISVGHDQIAAFYRADHIEKLVEQTLAKNPDDVQALARLGEIMLTKDQTDEALTMLRKAQQAQPGDARIRGLLARVMLVLLRTDFVNHHELIPEARELIKDPAQRRELLRLQAVGLHKAGLVAESLEAFVTLADELQTEAGADDGPNAQMEHIDNKWQVRTSRWLQARLTELYTNSKAADRAQLQARLEDRLAACLKSNSLTNTRRFVEIYGFHPLADRARLLLVQKLIAEKGLLEAELRAGDLLESADPNYHAAGLAALVEVYDLAGRTHLAAERYAEFTEEIARHPLDEKHPAAEFVAKGFFSKNVVRRQLVLDSWPGGKVQKVDGNLENGRARPYMNNYSSVNLVEHTGPAPRGMRAMYDASQQAVFVVDSLGRTIAQAPIRRTDGIYRSYITPPYTGLTGRATGHVVVVHAGGEVLAIDALRQNRGATEPLLWRGEVITVDPLLNRTYYPQARQVTNPVIGTRMTAYDQSGQTNYQPGPVTPLGVVYQRSKQLICADPITGVTMWERNGLDNACELFGDDELVFAVPTNSDEATVYSMRDGAELGTRRVGRSSSRLTTNGRRILGWEQVGNGIRLRLFDAWSEKEDLWQLETPLGCKGQIVGGSEFALLENSGKFTVLSLATGQKVLSSQLEAEKELHSLYVWPSQEQYTVLANRPIDTSLPVRTQPISGGSMGGQHAHGNVYALDRTTGKNRWPVPAFISQHGIPYDQPADSPLLVFLCNRQGATPNQWTSTLLCLDKRTGAVAYEGDIATAQANMCEVMADLERELVQITTGVQPGTMRVTLLKLTNEPQPPQTPAQLGIMSSLGAGQPPGKSVNVSEGLLDPNGRPRPVPVPAPADPFGAAPVPAPGPRLPPNLPPQIAERIKQLQQEAEQRRQAAQDPNR